METIDNLLRKTPKMIRWIFAPLIAIIIGFLAQALLYIVFHSSMYLSHVDPLNPFYKISSFAIEAMRNCVMTGMFVMTFMYIVPKYKNIVGIVALCLVVSILSISSFIMILQERYGDIEYWLAVVLSLVGAALGYKLYLDTTDKKPSEKEF